jgi:hypothetical protein
MMFVFLKGGFVFVCFFLKILGRRARQDGTFFLPMNFLPGRALKFTHEIPGGG